MSKQSLTIKRGASGYIVEVEPDAVSHDFERLFEVLEFVDEFFGADTSPSK